MARKSRSDSVKGQVSAMQAAISEELAGIIAPPAHIKLRDGDWPFWSAITRARAKEAWSSVDLMHAANLARCMADIEKFQKEVDEKGATLVNYKGTVVTNPVFAALETLTRRAVALSRMLHVHPEATEGESKDLRKKVGARKDAKEKVGKVKGDGLIPGIDGDSLH